ncbi:hypothetical protein CRENBAI_022915 [Crenichthys baileyi]|uniref:Uncharacterized protein n=1 Tax=Crenichthys baileyi TaxID=28760 RepID=A0AAV9QS82_9TELE
MCGVCRGVSYPFHDPRPVQVLDGGKPKPLLIGVTQKGRRSCLHMAPGACGFRLANQLPKRAIHYHGGSVRSHRDEAFPKAFPVLLASRQAVTLLPFCVFHKHAGGPEGTRG